MASSAVAALPIDAAPYDIVDWLEFEAFFDPFGVGRIDEALNALKIQAPDAVENIGDGDAEEDRLREAIENEVRRRQGGLTDAYPFDLSADGEVLCLKPRDQLHGPAFYLVCLVLSHVTRSAILAQPPSDGEVRDVRKDHFQILSTLALAGLVTGPALSLGWPRASGEDILSVVARGCAGSGTGKARLVPADTANPAAKDGGIDVLGWEPLVDRPPPASYWFGQAASGHGWSKKSSRDESDGFLQDYFDVRPQCNYSFVTICPFLVSPEDMLLHARRHGMILDRTRAPKAALDGLRLARAGLDVDELNRTYMLAGWLARYRREVRRAA